MRFRPAVTSIVAILGSVLASHAAAFADIPPPRPAAALALHQGELRQIVGADGQRPLVQVGERSVRAQASAAIVIMVGEQFAEGQVEVRSESPEGWDGTVGSTASGEVVFTGTLVPEFDIDDVFVVVLAYNDQGDGSEPPAFRAVVSEVGNLKAGSSTDFRARMSPIREPGNWDWSVLVFSGGLEVPVEESNHVLARFFDATERHQLAQEIDERRGGPDAPLSLGRNFPVRLPKELMETYEGATVGVRLVIGSDGSVSDLELAELEDPALEAEIAEQLAHWLFIPSFKDGEPIEQKVVLPLQF